jgi:hypothetical protein
VPDRGPPRDVKYLPLRSLSFPGRITDLALVFCLLHLFCLAVLAHPEISTSEDDKTVIVNDAPEQEVYVIGKSVVVKKRAKGVLAVGGDVTIEGRISGDVATIGGNIIQKDDAYIGGDVIVFGGAYKPESQTPLREAGKQTVMFGVFEEEFRNFGQNPSQIFSPNLTIGFVAQRLVLALFWFVISMVMTTIAPGAVGRAVARINLNTLKITALGAGSLIVTSSAIVAGVILLPNYLAATLALMGILMLVLGYVFGRVALQVTVGKLVQKHLLSDTSRSETMAIFAGVVIWTVLLSIPYLWLLSLFAVFAIGIGLILTGRSPSRWQTP